MSAADHALSPLAARAAAHAVQTLVPGQALTLRPARTATIRLNVPSRPTATAPWFSLHSPHIRSMY